MNKLSESKWVVYMIETESGSLYTGISNNLQARFDAHQNSNKGARFFRLSIPQKIVYQETHANRSEASKREYAIKKLTRKAKLELIGAAINESLQHKR